MPIEAVPLVPLPEKCRAELVQALEDATEQAKSGELKAIIAILINRDGDFIVEVQGDIKVTHLVGFLELAKWDLLHRRAVVNGEAAG